MTSDNSDLTMVAGETKTIIFTRQEPDGTAQDVTGATFEAKVREGQSPALPVILDIAARLLVTNGAGGIITMTLTESDTNQTNADSLTWEVAGFSGYYDILMILPSGDQQMLVPKSRFSVTSRVSS